MNTLNPQDIKFRNTIELRSNGIKVIEHLPHLEMPTFRNSTAIAKRMLVLEALFQLNLEAPKHIIAAWIKSNELEDSLLRNEKIFLETDYHQLKKQDQIDIYWYVEAIWTFAWIGGLHNNLTFNTPVEDSLATLLPNIEQNESAKHTIENYQLRDQSEIFEKLDAFYRAHWYARHCSLNQIETNLVDLDIIMERRKALEYTCYNNLNWNNIPLNT